MTKQMFWSFGALSDGLQEQADRQGFTLPNSDRWQKIADGLIMAWIHDCLTDSMYDKALERLAKRLNSDLSIKAEPDSNGGEKIHE